jgi:hypothetical protein
MSCNHVFAQFSISTGSHLLEVGGSVASFYNYRQLKSGENKFDKNRFGLRDVQLNIEGRKGNEIEYKFQIDFADLAENGNDAENPGLMDAWVAYKGISWLEIKLGYGKISYSRSSLVPFSYSAWWQRAEMARGNLFSRRDVGLTLSNSFLQRRINLSAGVYTGLGENSLRAGENDDSGMPEFAGRAEFCWPSYYRHRDVDTRHVPIPMFALGLNARYSHKRLPTGSFFPAGSTGDWGIRVLNGERKLYGLDLSAQYMGFSAQFEIHQSELIPSDTASSLLRKIPVKLSGGKVYAGAWSGQLAYFSKRLRTIFSARMESYNINDLSEGFATLYSGAICYQLDGFASMIRLQFLYAEDEDPLEPLDWQSQWRLGWQYLF